MSGVASRDPWRVGVVGLGMISGVYIDTLRQSDRVRIVALADIDPAKAEAAAASLPDARATTVEALLASPDVDVVLNLTIPAVHASIDLLAIEHGKHVYSEKPLAVTFEDGASVVRAAAAAGVRVGCAPDTILGAGIQTARAAVERGVIGRPLAASASLASPGPEPWHLAPDFFYLPGGGPLMDMGPYYVSALVHLLGPVRSAVGMTSSLRSERVIGSGARAGERIPVEVETHVAGVLQHEGGAISTLIMSFDSARSDASPIEVHGELGSLTVPDPNTFDGEVAVFPTAANAWRPLPASAGFEDGARGVGLLEMLDAIERGQPAQTDAALALHVLDVFRAVLTASKEGRRVEVTSTPQLLATVPLTSKERWSGAAP